MERDLANNPDKNNHKFARYIKSKKKSRNTIGPLKTEDGKLLTQSVEMAEELNRFFSSVFTKEAPDNISVPRREEMKTDMRSVKVTPAHVRDQIKNLRADSAPGPDGISPRVLKELKAEASIPLSIIFNKSLTETVVPADLELGNVTPIPSSVPHKRSVQIARIHHKRQNHGTSAGKQFDPPQPARLYAGEVLRIQPYSFHGQGDKSCGQWEKCQHF
jgi:hypothetical protein